MNGNELERINVSAGIVCRRGLFLATQRQDNKPLSGFWELPGGKQEGHETPDETLCRELAEELGINVTAWRLLQTVEHTYEDRGFTAVVHFFIVLAFEGEPTPNENQNMRWLGPSQIADMDFLPADAHVLKYLCESDFDVSPKKL